MKKFICCLCLILICTTTICLTACDSNGNADSVLEVSNQYFNETSFEKSVYTSIGVNGHPGDGIKYIIKVWTSCSVSLSEYSVKVKLYSKDNILLDTFDKSGACNLLAGDKLTIDNTVSYELYNQIDYVVANWQGKSKVNATTTSGSNTENENKYTWIVVGLISSLFIVFLIFILAIKKTGKKDTTVSNTSNVPKQTPVVFTNKVNKDITILAMSNYTEISVQISLYDNNQLIKEYTIKELNFEQNEQRVIGNINDYKAEQIRYKIVGYK